MENLEEIALRLNEERFILQKENERLKQERKELIEWLNKERIINENRYIEFDRRITKFYDYKRCIEEILQKLKGN